MVRLHLPLAGDDDAVTLAASTVVLDGVAQQVLIDDHVLCNPARGVARVGTLLLLDDIAIRVEQDDVVRSAPLGEDDHRGRDGRGCGVVVHERSYLESRYLLRT